MSKCLLGIVRDVKWTSSRSDHLQLGQDGRGVRSLDTIGRLLGVGDLAVVDDEGVAAGPLAERPADLLGELGLCVRREHLRFGGFACEPMFPP